MLFSDEAETLFGRRTEVPDAHDRYANLEVFYLLSACPFVSRGGSSRMEQFGWTSDPATVAAPPQMSEALLGAYARTSWIVDDGGLLYLASVISS